MLLKIEHHKTTAFGVPQSQVSCKRAYAKFLPDRRVDERMTNSGPGPHIDIPGKLIRLIEMRMCFYGLMKTHSSHTRPDCC